MEYSIKEIARCIEISEQGLYKRIKTNYEDYLKKGFIVLNQVEQPSGTKEQIFITKKGLEDLLKTKQMRKGATLKGFEGLNQKTKPLNQVEQLVEQPLNQTTKLKDVQTASDSLLNLLNQNIADLKEENKRLNEKLEKQEARFDKKLEEQKQEFKEQYEKQQELYQKTLDRIMQSFQNALLQLPKPKEEDTETETARDTTEIIQQEPIKEDATISREEAERETETEQEAEQKQKGVKSFFKRLFSK